jgi:histidyl-tRNA synthetase
MNKLPPLLSDRLPATLAAQHSTIHNLQHHLHHFGYELIDTPLVEQAELFLVKAGDAAINRLMTFDLPGRTLSLRPEFTVPAARVYLTHYPDQPGPVRLQFAGPVLQYGNLQHGQIKQENAIGAELINDASPAADAEIIALTGQALNNAGCDDWQVIIGHSGLIDRFLTHYQLNRQMHRFVMAWLPRLKAGERVINEAAAALAAKTAPPPTIESPTATAASTEIALQALLHATPQRGPSGGRTREEIAQRLLGKQQQTDQHDRALNALRDLQHIIMQVNTPADLQQHFSDPALQSTVQHLAETFALLSAYAIPETRITFDLSFTRNLDYYTGIVFEYRAGDCLLGGGGRYDELIGLLGEQDQKRIPAVGFMLYVDHILQVTNGADPITSPVRVSITPVDQTLAPATIKLAMALRNAGRTTITTAPEATPQPMPNTTHQIIIESPAAARLIDRQTGSSTTIDPSDTASLLTLLEKNA